MRILWTKCSGTGTRTLVSCVLGFILKGKCANHLHHTKYLYHFSQLYNTTPPPYYSFTHPQQHLTSPSSNTPIPVCNKHQLFSTSCVGNKHCKLHHFLLSSCNRDWLDQFHVQGHKSWIYTYRMICCNNFHMYTIQFVGFNTLYTKRCKNDHPNTFNVQ